MLFSRRDAAAGSAKTPCLITTALVVVAVISPLLSLGAIVLRFYARGRSRAKLMADDWWMVAGWVFASSLSIPVWVYGSITGLDYYKIDPLVGTTYSLQSLYVASILTLPALTLVKISILLFYKRVFSILKFKIVVWSLISILGAWCIVFIFLTALQGDPLDSPWKLTGTFRYDIAAVGYAQVGSNIGLDFIVLCLPLPVISTLRMAWTRKLSLSLILWLGVFCVIASIVRVVFLSQLLSAVVEAKSAIAIQSKQFVFLMVEPHVAIVAGCLPCYGPLLKGLGGRAPESIVRSVRSIISLASLGSRSPNGSRGSRSRTGRTSGTPAAIPKDSQGGESQVELGAVPPASEAGHDDRYSRESQA